MLFLLTSQGSSVDQEMGPRIFHKLQPSPVDFSASNIIKLANTYLSVLL